MTLGYRQRSLSAADAERRKDLLAQEKELGPENENVGIDPDLCDPEDSPDYRYSLQMWMLDSRKMFKKDVIASNYPEESAAQLLERAREPRRERFCKADEEYFRTWKERQDAAAEERSRARRTAGMVPEEMATVAAARQRLEALRGTHDWKMRRYFRKAEYNELEGRGHRGWILPEAGGPTAENPTGASAPSLQRKAGKKSTTPKKAKQRKSRRNNDNDPWSPGGRSGMDREAQEDDEEGQEDEADE